jgi:hypothetical protein
MGHGLRRDDGLRSGGEEKLRRPREGKDPASVSFAGGEAVNLSAASVWVPAFAGMMV